MAQKFPERRDLWTESYRVSKSYSVEEGKLQTEEAGAMNASCMWNGSDCGQLSGEKWREVQTLRSPDPARLQIFVFKIPAATRSTDGLYAEVVRYLILVSLEKVGFEGGQMESVYLIWKQARAHIYNEKNPNWANVSRDSENRINYFIIHQIPWRPNLCCYYARSEGKGLRPNTWSLPSRNSWSLQELQIPFVIIWCTKQHKAGRFFFIPMFVKPSVMVATQ